MDDAGSAAGGKIRHSVRSLLLSPTHQVAALYAVTGLGFAAANLILAAILPVVDYGTLALVVSIVGVAAPLAPLGADGVVNRRLLRPRRGLLVRVCGTSSGVSLLFGAVAYLLYGVQLAIVGMLVAGLVAGGVTMVAAASFQRLQRFTAALLLEQSANLFLIVASLVMWVVGPRAVWFPIAVIALGYALTALESWRALLRWHAEPSALEAPFPWHEALLYAGVSAAGLLLLQSERLLIPWVLSLEELASFGVLAAVVIAPFRTLQMGVGMAVLPRMRAAASPAARRRLLRAEALRLAVTVLGGGAALLWVAPPLLAFLFGDKFHFPPGLVLAGVAAGAARVVGGLWKGVATALCTTRELGELNLLIWVSAGVAVVAGGAGARFGLVGLVYGVALAWLTLSAACAWKALPHLARTA